MDFCQGNSADRLQYFWEAWKVPVLVCWQIMNVPQSCGSPFFLLTHAVKEIKSVLNQIMRKPGFHVSPSTRQTLASSNVVCHSPPRYTSPHISAVFLEQGIKPLPWLLMQYTNTDFTATSQFSSSMHSFWTCSSPILPLVCNTPTIASLIWKKQRKKPHFCNLPWVTEIHKYKSLQNNYTIPLIYMRRKGSLRQILWKTKYREEK